VDVYLIRDDDKPLAVTGRKASRSWWATDRRVRVRLEPAGPDRPAVKAADRVRDAHGVVHITEIAGGPVQAQLQPSAVFGPSATA
jgi:hypothetical protein